MVRTEVECREIYWYTQFCPRRAPLIASLLVNTVRPHQCSVAPASLTPVDRWVQLKIACLVDQSLSGQSPKCLAGGIHLVSEEDCRWLRSTSDRMFVVPRTHNTFSDRNFAAAGMRLWNSLPPALRAENLSYREIKRLLKTFLFL